jgi:transposase-like protein
MRYETLHKDYEKLCDVIGLPKETLPHLKGNQRKSKIHYTDYYSDWSKIQVKMAFRDVISRFGYSFAA